MGGELVRDRAPDAAEMLFATSPRGRPRVRAHHQAFQMYLAAPAADAGFPRPAPTRCNSRPRVPR